MAPAFRFCLSNSTLAHARPIRYSFFLSVTHHCNTYTAFGIGIKNVDDRIKLTYGNAYGQTIKTKPGEGVEVIIRQPLVLSEEEWEEKYV